MKFSPVARILGVAFFLQALPAASFAFTLTGGAWSAGSTVVIQLELGSTSVTLLDGLGTWNNSAADALALWNQHLDFIQFASVSDSIAPKGSPDGYNSVFFSSNIFGEGFGQDTLAVTVWWNDSESNSIRTEADVVFNSAQKFNSYRGSLLVGTYDFHRIALHEFGHVLGLGHVDNYPTGQALMEPVITNLDHQASDDIAGAVFLYGYRITSYPVVTGVVVGDAFSYLVTANNSPTSFSAIGLPPGLEINAATGEIHGICTLAGTYEVTVTAHGPVKDATGILTIIFAPAAITSDHGVGPVDVGTPLSYAITAANNPTSFTASGLPPGLVLDTKSGVISGVPTVSGFYYASVTAHGLSYDAAGIIFFSVMPHYQDVVATLGVNAPVQRMIPDPVRSRLYIVTYSDVAIIDTVNLSIITTIPLDGFGLDATISADGSTLWVLIGDYPGVVHGFSLVDFSALPEIPNGPFIGDSIRAGINGKIYLVNSVGLFQVDTATGVTRELKARVNMNLGWSMEVSPDQRNLYLAYQNHYPGMIAHYDIASAVPVLVEERAGLGYVGPVLVSADGQSIIYNDYELTPVAQTDLFALSTSSLGSSPRVLETPSTYNIWSLSHDSSVAYVFPPYPETIVSLYHFDFVSIANGFPVNRWTLPAIPDHLADDGIGSYLFMCNFTYVAVYSLQTSIATGPPPAPKTLLNVSTRAVVGTDDQQQIAGFIITGDLPKNVALRSIGPSLPLPNPISDPLIQVYDSRGALVASNDNWNTQREELVAAGLAPWDEHDSGMILTLDPGSYTAVVKNVDGARGIGLVELYDLSSDGTSKLANLSTRGQVGTDNDVLIGGFIIGGSDATKVILRAIGPSLIDAGVSGILLDPVLELHGGNGELISQNDNWRSNQEAEILTTSIPPSDDRESAIVATLQPGSYTAIVRGQNNTTGVGLVELYNLDSAAAANRQAR